MADDAAEEVEAARALPFVETHETAVEPVGGDIAMEKRVVQGDGRLDVKDLERGDYVSYLRDGESRTRVARIIDVWWNRTGLSDAVTLQPFYRPEDADGGRRPWHGRMEVFKDKSVREWAKMETFQDELVGRCRVHTLEGYEKLDKVDPQKDFFWRVCYDPDTKAFEPDRVPLYCVCETPYSPDRPMIECSECGNVFHCSCMGLDPGALPRCPFRCPTCTKRFDACLVPGESLDEQDGGESETQELSVDFPETLSGTLPEGEVFFGTDEGQAQPQQSAKRGRKPKLLTKTGRKRSKRDPGLPKRPLSAYNYFMKDFRKAYKAEHPESRGVADVTRAGSQAWHALGQEDREPYHVMATASRENYHKAKEDYIQSGGRMLFELQQRNFKPKRPLTPYFLFLEKARSEANEVKVEGGAGAQDAVEFTKEASRRWNSMTSDEKEPFYRQAEEAKAKSAVQKEHLSMVEDILSLPAGDGRDKMSSMNVVHNILK